MLIYKLHFKLSKIQLINIIMLVSLDFIYIICVYYIYYIILLTNHIYIININCNMIRNIKYLFRSMQGKFTKDTTVTLHTGRKIPMIGYGTYQLRGEDCVRGTKIALTNGYTHIDTASIYRN